MPHDLLFVYGTLRRDSHHPMHQLLAGHGEFVDYATGPGQLYQLDGYPGMVDAAGSADRVKGEIWRLKHFARAIRELDDYEECGTSPDNPGLYTRLLQPFETSAGTVDAWYYRYNDSIAGRQRIASGDYVEFTASSPAEPAAHSGGGK